MLGEAQTLANEQSPQEVPTTTTPTEKHNIKTSPGEVGRFDWLPGEDTLVTM